jgi:hypothetical protein
MELSLHVVGEKVRGGFRAGSRSDAFELLALLLRDHRQEDGEPAPLDMAVLLPREDVLT